jgi:ribosomal protein S18 acetylase RimI-like enzyme
MSIILRSGHVTDASAVLALWRIADAAPTHTDDIPSLERLLTFDRDALVVAEEDGTMLGTVIAAWDGWRGSIYRLVVDPSHRRSGVGRRLLEEGERRLHERGAVRLAAIVVATDSRSTGFWQGSDWQRQAERLRFVKG